MRKSITICVCLAWMSFWASEVVFAQETLPTRTLESAWQSPAEFHRTLKKSVKGTLTVDDNSIEFRSVKFSHRWIYSEIKTFDLTTPRQPRKGHSAAAGPTDLVITDYENRHWHEPGEQRFHFTLAQSIPPALASSLADRVARPVINGNPPLETVALADIPAHRRERFGGSNGTLRFRVDGIDYVTPDGRGARSWRWRDIQTLANPNPWEFRVTGWREIVEFDLKQPLSRQLFDRLWDRLYAADLNLAPGDQGDHHGGHQ